MCIEKLVRHCAPTLAGLKVGSLVSHTYEDINELEQNIESRNKLLNPKGIYFIILKKSKNHALIYVYRKKQLLSVLQDLKIRKFLCEYGYDNDFDLQECFDVLHSHLKRKDFPHEIGVFLGYPLEDIKAFIRYKGLHCPCVGYWKSYTDIDYAQKVFAKYRKCTRVYCDKLAQGFDISRLTVAIV